MTASRIAGGLAAAALVLLVGGLVVRFTVFDEDTRPIASASPAPTVPAAPPARASAPGAEAHPGFIYGRITDTDGGTYEGRLRWGGDQEAFWGDFFNGVKTKNPWTSYVPGAADRQSIEIFGFTFGGDQNGLVRQFMNRFGDISRVEAHFRTVDVTLKSGARFELDRFAAGDIDDGVRVWDSRRGVINLDARRIRLIEFAAAPPIASAPVRLHGTVRTRLGNFTGFVQWDQQQSVGTDELHGRTSEGDATFRYDTVRSIARRSRDSALVTLADGREVQLSGTAAVSSRNRGIYVDDGRYGRVLISWDAFERADFSDGGSGPRYDDFAPGRQLAGHVITRNGRRLSGRLVYDFDESETTETLDVQSQDVDFNIPFSLISSVVIRGGDGRATVMLHDGEILRLDRTGDLSDRNAGVLVFVDGRDDPEHVPWNEVERVDFDRAK